MQGSGRRFHFLRMPHIAGWQCWTLFLHQGPWVSTACAASGSSPLTTSLCRPIRRARSSILTNGSSPRRPDVSISSPIAKYASCSWTHGSQKGMPLIFTTAGRRQGRSVLLRTWHSVSSVVSVKIISLPPAIQRARVQQGSHLYRYVLGGTRLLPSVASVRCARPRQEDRAPGISALEGKHSQRVPYSVRIARYLREPHQTP